MGFNLLFDIGNSNIVGALYQDKNRIHQWRMTTDTTQEAATYCRVIMQQLQPFKFPGNHISRIVFSSVVPALSRVFSRLCSSCFSASWMEVTYATPLGLRFSADPSYLGADLIVNAYAARELYQRDCIVTDLGTATTIQLVGKDGDFFGTAILPGVKTGCDSITQRAAKLQNITLRQPRHLLGLNTEDALLSGSITGHRLLLDGFIREIKAAYPTRSIYTVATGGLAPLICANAQEIDTINPDLMIEGLLKICIEKL